MPPLMPVASDCFRCRDVILPCVTLADVRLTLLTRFSAPRTAITPPSSTAIIIIAMPLMPR